MEAETIATYLLGGQVEGRFERTVTEVFGGRQGLVLAAAGFAGGITTALVIVRVLSRRRRALRTGPSQ